MEETDAHTEHSGDLQSVILEPLSEVGEEQAEKDLGVTQSSFPKWPDGKPPLYRAWGEY